MAHDIFISYALSDKTTADAACTILELRGIRCWTAPRDIVPGVDYGEAIIDAINEAKVFLLVFSAAANQSGQVKREVERAVSRGIPIIPLRIEDVKPSKSLEYFISSPHWLDAFSPPLKRHLDKLAVVIQALLTQAPPPEASTQRTTVSIEWGKWASGVPFGRPNVAAGLGVLLVLVVVAAIVFRLQGIRGTALIEAGAASPLALKITAPMPTQSVAPHQLVTGEAASGVDKIWLIVRPLPAGGCWAQGPTVARADETWGIVGQFGEIGIRDAGKPYQIRAMADPHMPPGATLEAGEVSCDLQAKYYSEPIQVTRN